MGIFKDPRPLKHDLGLSVESDSFQKPVVLSKLEEAAELFLELLTVPTLHRLFDGQIIRKHYSYRIDGLCCECVFHR